MADLPGPIREFIDALTDDLLAPAFMLISDEGGLIDWGGALASYGIRGLEENMQVGNHVPSLMGILPVGSGSVFLPRVQTAPQVFADVYFFRRHEGTWILLLAATDDVKKRQALHSALTTLHSELLNSNTKAEHFTTLIIGWRSAFKNRPQNCRKRWSGCSRNWLKADNGSRH